MKYMLVLALLTTLCLPSYSQDVFKLVYFNNFPPFSWEVTSEGSAKMKGIYIDVMNEALGKRMNMKLSHSGYPWARAQTFVKTGEADAFITFPSEVRKTYSHVTKGSIIAMTNSFYTRKDHPKLSEFRTIQSLSELKSYQLVDYVGNGWAKQTLVNMNVQWFSSFDQILHFLAKGRGDIHIGPTHMVRYNLKRLGYKDRIIEFPGFFKASPAHLCLSKRSRFTHIMPEFEKVLKGMRQDGSFKRILDGYQ